MFKAKRSREATAVGSGVVGLLIDFVVVVVVVDVDVVDVFLCCLILLLL